MNRVTENLLLFMVGLAIAVITFMGTYTRYVKPSLFPWLIAAAIFVIALALTGIVRDARRLIGGKVRVGDGGGHSHAGHKHAPSIVWLLALPAAVLVFVPAPALGAHTTNPTDKSAASPGKKNIPDWLQPIVYSPLPAGRAPEVGLNDVQLRLDDDVGRSLDGRTITVTGFTINKGAETDVGRFYIICCAADALLNRVKLVGPAAPAAAGLPDETWVTVEGVVVKGATPTAVPSFVASHVQPISEPARPYEFPT